MDKLRRLIQRLRFQLCTLMAGGRIAAEGRNYFDAGEIAVTGTLNAGTMNILSRGHDLEVKGVLHLGAGNFFNKNVKIVCMEKITFGSSCIVGDGVHFYDHDHNCADLAVPIKDQGYTTRPICIGSNVWIGAKATILKGVTVGDGAVIGAAAVVTRDVPANAIAAGNPAVVIKTRGNGR